MELVRRCLVIIDNEKVWVKADEWEGDTPLKVQVHLLPDEGYIFKNVHEDIYRSYLIYNYHNPKEWAEIIYNGTMIENIEE